MPKKGSAGDYNWSFAFSPRKSRPRPKLFQEDRRTLHNILIDSVKDYKYRQNEVFKRMKATTFVQLILHVAEFRSSGNQPLPSNSDTPFRPDTADLEVQKIQNVGAVGSRLSNHLVGVSSYNPLDSGRFTREEILERMVKPEVKSDHSRPLVNTGACPFLLLDLRDREDFQHCHIITGRNYPIPMLARAFNFESKDMLQYKNQEGRIIVLYDNDETLAPRAAITLVERGYDNVFLLTGGMRVAKKLFPRGLTTGQMQVSPAESAVGAKTKTGQPLSARTITCKTDFTQDDVDCLHMYLDNALRDNSSGSRLTQRPKGPSGRWTTMTCLSSTTTTTGTGRPPFKT